MKDKVLLVLKIIGIIVFFPLILIGWVVSVLITSILRIKDKKVLENPIGKFIEVDGHRMNVLVKGEGEHTIVFLPGLCSSSPVLEFKPLYSQLEKDFKIVVPEKFGYGFSDIVKENRDYMNTVEQYRKAFEILGIKGPYILCAHSLGGNEVELWEQHYPDEVEAFIGIDANLANYVCDWNKYWTFRHWRLESLYYQIFRVAGWSRNGFRPNLEKVLCKEDLRILRALNTKNDSNIDTYSELQNKFAANDLINSKPLPAQPTLQFVDAPEWFIKGEEGKYEENEESWIKSHEELVAASTNGKLSYSSCGHCIHCFEYERMANEIKEFVKTL